MRLLYESYRNNYRAWDWDYNCARVAYQLYLQRPDLLHVEPYKFTTPDWKERDKLWKQVIDWKDLYVIHVMTHFSYDSYTPESIKTINSTFGEAMRYIYYGSAKLITSWPLLIGSSTQKKFMTANLYMLFIFLFIMYKLQLKIN